LGPWGVLKTTAYSVGSAAWWAYALAFLALVYVLLPGLFYLVTCVARALEPAGRSPRQAFVAYAYALIPLGMAAWIAFTLSFVFANGSYLWPVLSDPLGWGWDLFRTAGVRWSPYLSRTVPFLQVAVLLGGLFWTVRTALRIAAEDAAARQAWPVILFCTLIVVGLLWLLVG